MYFPNAYKKTFFLSTTSGVTSSQIQLGSGLKSSELPAGQLGVYQAPTAATIALGTGNSLMYGPNVTSTANAVALNIGSPFYIAMGSWYKASGATVTSADKIGVHGGYQESVKSKIINPRYITRVIHIKAKGARSHVVKIKTASGANAPGLALETTYRLRIDAKGAPALRYLNHQLYRTLDYYTPTNVTNPTYVKDPIYAFLSWKDQINSNPLTSSLLQARVYKYGAGSTGSITGSGTPTTTTATLLIANTTGATVGRKVTGNSATGIPANSFITAVAASTSITITYPPQGLPPTIVNGTLHFWDEASTTDQAINTVFIPGTTVPTGVALTAHNVSDVPVATGFNYPSGQEPHLEISAAYYDTVFGNATFTPLDYYGVEPLQVQASMVDETGTPSYAAPTAIPAITTAISVAAPYLGTHAEQVQAPQSPIGLGEGIIRDMILDGRYRQEAFPDSSRVESFRMREIEQNPAFNSVTRSAYYDQVLIVHSVPRFNNPSGLFDTDQYVNQIVVPTGTAITNLTTPIIGAANNVQGANAVILEDLY